MHNISSRNEICAQNVNVGIDIIGLLWYSYINKKVGHVWYLVDRMNLMCPCLSALSGPVPTWY